MARWIRRLLLLAIVGGGSFYALRTLQQRRTAATDTGLAPQWPRFDSDTRVPVPTATPEAEIDGLVEIVEIVEVVEIVDEPAATTTDEEPAWVEPVDGACPDGYPIKAKSASKIFHVPGGRSYDRTVPERCYATAEAAEQDGYRQAKV